MEMAESMCASWLKHVKRCVVVQTNWKPSFQWSSGNDEFISTTLEKAVEFFNPHGISIASSDKNGSIDYYKALMQTECDVVGISMNGETAQYYAVESAFHSDGLDVNYADRIASKMVRIALCLLYFCHAKHVNVAFASPSVNKGVFVNVRKEVELVRKFFEDKSFAEQKFDANFELLVNEPDGNRRYDEGIVRPLCLMHPIVADLSESFVRAVSLREMTLGGCRVCGSDLRRALKDLNLKFEEFNQKCETYSGVLGLIQQLHDKRGSRRSAILDYVSWLYHDQLGGEHLTAVKVKQLAQDEKADELDGKENEYAKEDNKSEIQGKELKKTRTYDVSMDGKIVAKDLNMRKTVLVTIRKYIEKNPDVNLETLRQVFNKKINRYHEVVIMEGTPHDERRYIGPIALSEGQNILVCGEWIGLPSVRANWPNFLACAHDVGVSIQEHLG